MDDERDEELDVELAEEVRTAWFPWRPLALFVLLALACTLVAIGVAMWSAPAALVVGGVALAALSLFGLADL